MKKKKEKEYKKEDLMAKGLVGLVLALVIITTIVNILSSKKEKDSNIEVNISGNSTEQKTNMFSIDIEKLQTMNERDRMEYYFSYWIQLVEKGEYEEAYGILYPQFRETYFNSLSKFREYTQNTFPRMSGIKYTNIERNGDVYVLWVDISDVLNGTRSGATSINVVIRENGFANIEMSFSLVEGG